MPPTPWQRSRRQDHRRSTFFRARHHPGMASGTSSTHGAHGDTNPLASNIGRLCLTNWRNGYTAIPILSPEFGGSGFWFSGVDSAVLIVGESSGAETRQFKRHFGAGATPTPALILRR